jgi:hypothetical protein
MNRRKTDKAIPAHIFMRRLISLMLGVMAGAMAMVLVISAFRNGRSVEWQLNIINVLALTLFDLIATGSMEGS